VHGDVKARNVVIGEDGRARLTDFGCARNIESSRPIGGTPAFMAPEVARGEEQGPAADVWALGCTVLEMATGRAPWSDMDDVLAAVHRIGYTGSVPEVPAWLSAEAKDFLDGCFARNPRARCTAAQLLEHPFVALDFDARPAKPGHLSPKTTLHDAFWDSDTDDETDDMSASAFERIGALAASELPDWDSDEGWIDLQSEHHQTVHATLEAATEEAAADFFLWFQPSGAAESEQFAAFADAIEDLPHISVAVTDAAGRVGTSSECKPQYSFDHQGTQNVKSHHICNRDRVLIKRILLNFPFSVNRQAGAGKIEILFVCFFLF
jgi:mitogen-activated protein kinase kinase kinase 17/18